MADSNLWADGLNAWQSLSDGTKALLLVPLLLVAIFAALRLYNRSLRTHVPPRAQKAGPMLKALDEDVLRALSELRQGVEDVRQSLKRQSFDLIADTREEEREGASTGGSVQQACVRIRKILLEEYRLGRGPDEALQRVRQFLVMGHAESP